METDIDTLRRDLVSCEEAIVKQSKFDGMLIYPVDKGELVYLLEKRCDILNRMFEIHATDAEISRFEYVNDRLYQLTQEFNNWHLHLEQHMSAIHGLEGEPFHIQTTLDYYHDPDAPQLFTMEEEAFYGSRWNEMLTINCIMNENSYNNAACCSGEHICDMDDGDSWREGALQLTQFKHICICYLVHRLCVHMRYSIPDVLRMTSFYYNYELICSGDMIKGIL